MNKKLRSFLQVVAVIYLGKKVVKLDKEVRELREENQKIKDDAESDRLQSDREKLDQWMRLREMAEKYGMTDSLIEHGVTEEELEFFKGLIK